MMAGRGRNSPAAGGPARHIPVMLSEVLAALEPKDGEIIVDGTFGAGGYSQAILDRADCKIIAIDRDPEAFRLSRALAEAYPGRLVAAHARYSEMEEVAASEGFTPSTAWCSISASPRCSSIRPSAASPSPRTGRSTCAWAGKGRPRPTSSTRSTSRNSLISSSVLGEERRARAIAKAIVERRGEAPIATHGRARRHRRAACSAASATRPSTPPPAPFRRSRLYLNEELDELARGLSAAERLLKARRPARRRHLPFARGPHRQAVFCQPQRAAATRLAPSARGRGRNSRAKLPAS